MIIIIIIIIIIITITIITITIKNTLCDRINSSNRPPQ